MTENEVCVARRRIPNGFSSVYIWALYQHAYVDNMHTLYINMHMLKIPSFVKDASSEAGKRETVAHLGRSGPVGRVLSSKQEDPSSRLAWRNHPHVR